MPRKGMRSLCFSPKIPSHYSGTPPPSPSRFSSSSSSSPLRPSFSDSVMDQTLETAEPIILKWNPESTTFARVTSLFYESRREARDFIRTVNSLHKAMHFLSTQTSPLSDKLPRAHTLMQIAMKRLQKEFYQILSTNRAHLDPESVSVRSSRTSTSSFNDDVEDDHDVIRSLSEAEDASFQAMEDLKLIAECMISSGYAQDCSKIYKIIRKSIVDEGIYRLGVERFTSSQIHKMSWEALEMRIGNWLNAVRTAVKTLFHGERILCDHVFASSASLLESCFAEIAAEGAAILFSFPEHVAKHAKKSPEKIFRALDMYAAIADFWPEIDSTFSFDSTDAVKSQALASLVKLGEFARAAIGEFETAVLKDSAKSTVAGAGIHDLTIDAMGYLSNLADYSNILSDILADSPPPKKTRTLPETYNFGFSDSDESPAPAISVKMAWLVLVLLCKLDTKAKYYREVSLSYLFLANNLRYVVLKVRASNLRYLLGEEWLEKHDSKVKQFAKKYERLGWGHVIDSIPTDPVDPAPSKVKEMFVAFNASFDQAYRKQSACVVPDSKLRDEIKVSIAGEIVGPYREFYEGYRHKLEGVRYAASVVRYTPEDVGHHLSDLFFGHVDSGSTSSSPSPSHSTI